MPAATPVEGLLEQARHLAGLRRYDDALERLGRAAAASPGDADVHLQRAWTLWVADRPREALAAAETGCALAPDEEWGHRLRASALLDLGDVHAARAAARVAVELDPDGHLPWLVACDVERAAGRNGEAWGPAMKALELAPEAAIVHERIGRVALGLGRLDDAEKAFRHVLRLDAGDADALNQLGVVKVKRGDDVGAMELFTQALTVDASAPAPRRNLEDAAHRFLWGRELRLPRTGAGMFWLVLLCLLFNLAFVALLLLYVLWLPVRVVRARRRWYRIPERSRPWVAGRERRRFLDSLATWGLVAGLPAALVAGIGPGPRPGPAGPAGWAVLLAGLAMTGAALARVVPRLRRRAGRRAPGEAL